MRIAVDYEDEFHDGYDINNDVMHEDDNDDVDYDDDDQYGCGNDDNHDKNDVMMAMAVIRSCVVRMVPVIFILFVKIYFPHKDQPFQLKTDC